MSNKKVFVLIVLSVILLFAVAFHGTSDHKVLFEKAKYTMETKGDLQKAISLFNELIEKYPKEREYGAKSHLYIGLAYEKLGLTESAKSFQAVIDDYPEQIQIVKLAREKLSALKAAADVIESGNGDLVLQQVWANPLDNMGAPSPDGRYLSFVDWKTPQLGIYEISTGKITNLPSTTGTWQGTSMWAESSIWSPDGKHLAYVWYDYSKDQNGQTKPIALRIVGLDGSQPREIFADEDVGYPHPVQWTNDGKHILASLSKKGGKEIVLISVADGSVESLKKWEGDISAGMSLSPDGKYLAYTISPDSDSPQKDIFLLSTGESKDSALIEHPAMDFAPYWSPDGKNLLFFSNRSGSIGLWAQKVSAGKASGEARLIKHLNRLRPMGITQEGHLFMSFYEGGTDIYSATIDPVSGKVISGPERIVESNIGWNYATCYSPDGNYLAYISKRGVLPPGVSWGQESLIIRDLRSGEERELIPQLRTLVDGSRGQPQWSPDGSKILINGISKSGYFGQYLVSVSDANVTPLFDDRSNRRFEPVWSKDGKKLFYFIQGTADKNGVYLVNRGSGEVTKLSDESYVSELALHPDGKMLAVATSEAIKLLSISSGKMQELYKVRGHSLDMTIAWSPDGSRLYFASGFKKGKGVELWRVSADGSEAQNLGISFPRLKFISVHPDGKRLAFTVGDKDSKTSIWVMKNFLKEN